MLSVLYNFNVLNRIIPLPKFSSTKLLTLTLKIMVYEKNQETSTD